MPCSLKNFSFRNNHLLLHWLSVNIGPQYPLLSDIVTFVTKVLAVFHKRSQRPTSSVIAIAS